MTTVISENLRDAQRGGIPNTYHLVNSFVGLRFNNPNASSIIGKLFLIKKIESNRHINKFFFII